MAGRPHDPSLARALVQKAKRGGDPRALAGEARRLGDPYHVAWALAHLAADSRVPEAAARQLAGEALETVARVGEEWRRGELLVALAKPLQSRWPEGEAWADLALDAVHHLRAGPGHSSAVQGLATRLPRRHHARLLGEALRGDDPAEGGRAVLHGWLSGARPNPTEEQAIRKALSTVEDALLRTRLQGHLHFRARRAEAPLQASYWVEAIASARAAPAMERLTLLRALATLAADAADLDPLAAVELPDDATRARLLSALGARADQLKDKERAGAWLAAAAEATARISDAKAQANVRRNVAEGLAKLGRTAEADALRQAVAAAKPSAKPQPEPPRPAPPPAAPTAAPNPTGPVGSRPLLALYNGYDGGLKAPHLQAVARAAPLAIAFGFDLVLVGFPAADAAEVVRGVESESQVGEGGGFASRLLQEGRLKMVPREVHIRPDRWGVARHYVAMTQSPDPAKVADLPRLVASGATCLIMGLGPRGLPPQILGVAPHHLELTGSGVPLETATVMGVVAERLRTLRA